VGVEAYEPRLSGGFIVSILFHGALVAAFVTLRPGSSPPAPPVFKVQLIAMPAPEAAPVTATPAAPAPVAKPTPPPAAPPITKKAAPKAAPTKKTPAPAPTTAAPPAAAPPPAAVGRGSDVTNLVTAGIEFPYPGYINNIANSILKDFAVIHTGGGALRAEVSFIIRRDGTVDPESIRLVKSSGVFSFNQDALAAVEAAANRRAFGPLPPSFREDILPVRFSFDPSTIRR
jgi:outer membrane biosynthesis protein TonB